MPRSSKPITPGAGGYAPGLAPHIGLSRNMGGGFMGSAPHLSQGGSSSHGADMVAKYRAAAPMLGGQPAGRPVGLSGRASILTPAPQQSLPDSPYKKPGDDSL